MLQEDPKELRRDVPDDELNKIAQKVARVLARDLNTPEKIRQTLKFTESHFEIWPLKNEKELLAIEDPKNPHIEKLAKQMDALEKDKKAAGEEIQKLFKRDPRKHIDSLFINKEIGEILHTNRIMPLTYKDAEIGIMSRIMIQAMKHLDNTAKLQDLLRKDADKAKEFQKRKEADGKEPAAPEMQAALERFHTETAETTHLPYKLRGDEAPERER